jgi:hypothetical protein
MYGRCSILFGKMEERIPLERWDGTVKMGLEDVRMWVRFI